MTTSSVLSAAQQDPAPRPGAGSGRDGRIRVLHVITHLDRGGAQDNTLLTIEGLDRSRYEVDLAAGPGELEPRARAVSDQLFLLSSLRRPLADPGAVSTFLRLARLMARYDVVHTHGSKAGVLGRLAARARKVPAVVHTVHGFPVHDYMGPVMRRTLLAAERMGMRCSDAIVCVCEANAREAIELGVVRPRQLRVVVSGVPDDQVTLGDGRRVRAELGIPAEAPVVTSVTRLMEQKAPLDLVAAASAVLAAREDAHVVVVGDGPMRAEVEAAVAGHPRLHLLGFREDVPDVLAASDLVAYSSLWEGLGRALTESVIAGLPVVATAVNGVPDLVVDGVTGYLVPPRRPEVLAEKVLAVLARPDRGRGMGAAGAQRVAGQFGVDRMVSDLDALYQEVLSGGLRSQEVATWT